MKAIVFLRRFIPRSAFPISLAAATLLFVSPVMGVEVAGKWKGMYYFQDGRPPVQLTLNLSQSSTNAGVWGNSVEPNTFNKTGGELKANLRGHLEGNYLSFIKTYDGSKGYSHSVLYSGTVSKNGNSITGKWSVKNLVGNFEISRQ